MFTRSNDSCGFVLGADNQLRPGELMGTKYGIQSPLNVAPLMFELGGKPIC